MIVKMSRVYLAVNQTHRDELLNRLGRMNLLHFEPVKPEEAVQDEKTLQAIDDLERAIQILSSVQPGSGRPSLKPLEAARKAIEIQRSLMENHQKLKDLYRREEELKIWGDIRLDQFAYLQKRGIEVRFFRVPQALAGEIRADCREIIAPLPGKKVLAAVASRGGPFRVPEGSELVPLPAQDRAALLAEEKTIEADLEQDQEWLSKLAHSMGDLREKRAGLIREATFIKAQRSGLSQGKLFAVRGWLPCEKIDLLESRLTGEGFPVALHREPVTEEDVPPTLIRYPPWARPIGALFDMLGTLPGYREMDLSPFFMVAMPVFTALLIGDAGYGLLISLAALIFYPRLVRLTGRSRTRIILIFGLATLAWGILTANYFGVTPATLARGGGFVKSNQAGAGIDYEAFRAGKGPYSQAAKIMAQVAPFWREDPKTGRFLLIKVSLIIGCLHLLLARLRKMVELIPDQRFLAELGWAITLGAMLVLIWYLLFIGVERVPRAVWWVLLAAVFLSSWFAKPARNGFKRLALGFSSSLLPLINSFSDIMSYLRLFAVGLASYFIASAFNTLSLQVAEVATWFAAIPLLIFGHGLNLGLAAIAVFAHGVRLNMLEFSNNAGMQWSGYAYRPFNLGQTTITGEEKR